MPESEFVSISRASLLLGVNERSARRAAGHLSDTDRQIAAGCPTLVRLSALASQMGKPLPASEVSDTFPDLSDTKNKAPDSVSDKKDPLSDSGTDMSDKKAAVSDTGEATSAAQVLRESALVEQLKSEVEYLRSALAASQQIASQAQQLQLIAERKVGELEGKLLPAMEQERPSGLAGGDSTGDTVPVGGITTPSATEEPKRGFWARLRGRG
jgi:hypothetical protein